MYKIYGILLGEKESDGRKLLPNVAGVEPKIQIGYYMWCIKGDETTILIDTGLNDEHIKERNIYNVRYAQDQLKKIDVDPANIKTVIITHLHTDHFSSYQLYPDATFYIQKKEIEFFAGPAARFPQIKRIAGDMAEVMRLAYEKRVRYIDGDEQLFPGIRVALVGGHTPGSQVVVVTTHRGEVVICGDAIDLSRNLEEEVAALSVLDTVESLLSMDKIRALASSPELIIPGHDALTMKRFPILTEGIIEIG
ncbi:N-acyl homoserine lactonase family protein [Chloroflexota bacterium]